MPVERQNTKSPKSAEALSEARTGIAPDHQAFTNHIPPFNGGGAFARPHS